MTTSTKIDIACLNHAASGRARRHRPGFKQYVYLVERFEEPQPAGPTPRRPDCGTGPPAHLTARPKWMSFQDARRGKRHR